MYKKVYNQALKLASSIVVKREDIARVFETIESSQNYERWEALIRGDDPSRLFKKLDYDLIAEVIGSDNRSLMAYKNRNILTTIEEQKILEKHVIRYRDNYEELNLYYRELMGLPPKGEDGLKLIGNFGDPIITPFVGKKIHELESWVLDHMWNTGKMDLLIKENPKARYLNYTGLKSIPFHKARRAKHLDILYYSSADIPKSLEEKFMREYYIQRNFHLRTLYDDQLFILKGTYSGFIGILILIATMRGIFIDDLSELNLEEGYLDNILRSYDLYEEFADIHINRKITLIRNLDQLLKYSGSDKVLIMISKIFGYDTTINRYYMVKTHNKDEHGRYIFTYDSDGNPNYEEMYKLRFLKVDVSQERIDFNPSNFIDMKGVIDRDPLWQLEEDYMYKIKKADFNMDLSKYVSIENAYDLAGLVYEMAFFLNLLIDNREKTDSIYKVNNYASATFSNLFTYLIFFFACMAKRAGYAGNIHYAPNEIGRIIKFNLNVTPEEIKTVSDEYGLGINPLDFTFEKPAISMGVNEVKIYYNKYTEVYKKVEDLMYRETEYSRYKGLLALKRLLFTHFCLENTFKKKDGSPATTYLDMLEDLDPSLAAKVRLGNRKKIEEMTSYSIRMLEELFKDLNLKFLFSNTPDTQDDALANYFRKMVNLFLSSSTTLDTFDVVYTLKGDSAMVRTFTDVSTNRATYFGSGMKTWSSIVTHRVTEVNDQVSTASYVTSD